MQDNLVHLKLDSTSYWGWIPKCDLRGTHFPKLKSLELGEMTFTHDWQIEWIISHGGTLTSLSLRECPIIHDIWIDHTMDAEGYPVHTLGEDLDWDETTDTDGVGVWCGNRARWNEYFTRLIPGLPHLRHLEVGEASSFDPDNQEAAEHSWRNLYCAFWSENPFTPWACHHPSIGRGYDFMHDRCVPAPCFPQCEKEDLEALEQLMIAVRRRASHPI